MMRASVSTTPLATLRTTTVMGQEELANASSWETRSTSELQIPTAWRDDSISITVNTDNFADSQTVYLYVVDADGDANTSGLPVVIGEYYP